MNFVLIPRNGSTSIASALELHHEHKRASEVPAPRCAVVRHPAERARSAYKLALTNPHSLAKACLGDAKTFREFLQRDNLLTWPQSYWLDAPVDLLMRFETLPEEFERHFGEPLPLMNQSPMIDIGEDDCEDVIARRYQTDFWRFGHVPAT
jgi:hypothetical protein